MIRSRSQSFIAGSITALLIASGCAAPFTGESLAKVDRAISFRDVQRDPDQFKGSWVLFGGVIIASRITREGTIIEVLQRPLQSNDRPAETDATDGRFIVRSDKMIDTAVYHPGRPVTVIAEVAGRIDQPLDEIVYRYPLLEAKEMHLWPLTEQPRFYFGIGVYRHM